MSKFAFGGILLGAVLVFTLFIGSMFIEKIETGHVGVVYSANGGVQQEVLTEGWNIVGLFDKVIEYPIRKQTVTIESMTLATKDGKNVTLDFSYSFKNDPSKVVSIFKEFGPISSEDIAETYLQKRVYEASRFVVSKFTVLDLFGEGSAQASSDIQNRFTEDVSDEGFLIEDFVLGVPKPDTKTQEAIDARVNALQELDRKKTELEIAKMDAEQKRVTAQGDADRAIIEAEGRAKANIKIQASITTELIEYEKAKKWDGKLPTNTGSVIPYLSIK
jgi:regulator of protease activity HflC (stomatin/prohibitin superfamily)